ncbi:single-stranded-DNA-specific exonuclease RecJ [Sulfobacillus acidophilus]|uniref:Single-stranded-DNA-specific exonuclease RecJ n=1 Tax=Sulfobacillus acidophilus TaxID=53633 RepID=A0ABS3B0E8_9FIRM|nr:single-stranded-DNA-specific exonuclease RecJ [Sulfobacillus acidophilus]
MQANAVWKMRNFCEKSANNLKKELGINKMLAKILVARGIKELNQAQKFLSPSLADLPDPSGFKDMDKACKRIYNALLDKQVIGIFGDYDVDGVTSVCILQEFLTSLGAKVAIVIPNRLKDGYGLNKNGIDELYAKNAKIVVSVDCGITNHEEIDYAASLGLEVIVVDHHTVPVNFPKACAVINPHRDDCTRGAEHMCAAGVVFNLCIALRRYLRTQNYFTQIAEPNLKNLLDLVALGTVADVMPLINDNRIFVQKGLEIVKQAPRPGMRALLRVANVDAKKISSGTLGFHIGPRINAAGRLNSAMDAVELFSTKEFSRALQKAEFLDEQNQARREIEKQILQEAKEQIESFENHRSTKAYVVANESWHPGVVGIVASRLVDIYGKPTIVIGKGGKGSGRSIPAFHLHNALMAVSKELIGFGGHAHAVGVLANLNNISSFRHALANYAENTLTDSSLIKNIFYDSEIAIEEVTKSLIESIKKAAPFGRGNPEAVFRINNIQAANVRVLRGGHLKGNIADKLGLSFIAFGMENKESLFKKPLDMLFVPEINEYNGYQSLQLRVRDVAEFKG